MMNIRRLIGMGICGLCFVGMASICYAETNETVEQAEQVVTEAAQDVAETSQATDAVEQKIDEAGQALEQAEQKLEQAGEELGQAEQATEEMAEQVAEQVAQQTEDPMAKWMELIAPNEHHAALEAFVGNWNVTTEFWMTPDMPAQTATGTSEVSWMLDGRYIVEHFQTTGMGPDGSECTFKGVGITGYDNVKGEYVGVWMDTMSTAPVTSHGQMEDQTLTIDCQFDCPIEGPTSMRMISKIVSPDEIVVEAFKKSEGKDEYKCMVITYTRQ